jgi:hypothetical protein
VNHTLAADANLRVIKQALIRGKTVAEIPVSAYLLACGRPAGPPIKSTAGRLAP